MIIRYQKLIILQTFPHELLVLIGGGELCILRLVCRRWRNLIPKRCLSKNYARKIVELLKDRYSTLAGIEPHIYTLW